VLPNHVLTELARLRPRNATVLARKLAKGAPFVESRIDEIIATITQAMKDFQSKGKGETEGDKVKEDKAMDASGPSTPAERSSKRAKIHDKPSPKLKPTASPYRPPADLWADTILSKPSANRATTSSLFGGKASGKAPPSATQAASSSSLFGSTLKEKKPSATVSRSSRMPSPGFMSIQAAIHDALAPAANAIPMEVEPTPSVGANSVTPNAASGVAEPETVEFIPAAKRNIAESDSKTGTSDAGSSSRGAAEVPSAPAPKDTIVAVKKKKTKKSKTAEQSSAPASEPSSPGAAASEPPAPAAPTKKKAKIQPGAIPEFDYAAEPNLLDDPSVAVASAAGKRGKKSKSKGKDAATNDKKKKPCE